MKKMIFGAILLLSGLIWTIVLTFLSVVYPWSYNGSEGLMGFLLGSKTIYVFLIACALSVTGLVICLYEAYIKK